MTKNHKNSVYIERWHKNDIVKMPITTAPNKNHSRKSWIYVKICL